LANASSHAFDVLIKPETEGKVSATVLGLPEYRAEGCDRLTTPTVNLSDRQNPNKSFVEGKSPFKGNVK
jgi:hypothetical protein